jgi:hypothetical protein
MGNCIQDVNFDSVEPLFRAVTRLELDAMPISLHLSTFRDNNVELWSEKGALLFARD